MTADDIETFFRVLAFFSGLWTILSVLWMTSDIVDGRRSTMSLCSAALGFWMTALCVSIAAAAS
jgi:hypothetical protein